MKRSIVERAHVCVLLVFLGGCTEAYADSARPAPSVDAGAKPQADITEQSPTEHTIRRSVYDALVAKGEIGAHATVETKATDGGPPLFYVRGLARGDVGWKVGLRDGDRIVSVMGQPLTSAGAIFVAYSSAQGASLVTATVERKGKLINLVLHVVP